MRLSNAHPQTVEIHFLVLQRIQRLAAALGDVIGELHHLVDGFLAGEPPHEIVDDGAQLGFGFAGFEIEQNLDHHGHHDVHPAGADQREGAVEIEQRGAGVARRKSEGRIASSIFHETAYNQYSHFPAATT